MLALVHYNWYLICIGAVEIQVQKQGNDGVLWIGNLGISESLGNLNMGAKNESEYFGNELWVFIKVFSQ